MRQTERVQNDTPRHVPDSAREAAYGAWQPARRDGFAEGSFATDPAKLQPRVRTGMKAAAEHLRKYLPLGVTQDQLDRLIEYIEAPWGVLIERQIRDCIERTRRS